MGLDTTHGCWHGPYSAFGRFREYVARAAGIPLPLMEGFYRPPAQDAMDWVAPRDGGPVCDSPHGPRLWHWVIEASQWLPLSWKRYESDPICYLLNHSDCDGEIAPEHCGPLADRLEELEPRILASIPPEDHRAGHMAKSIGNWIRGLRKAAAAGEPVEFH